MMRRSAASSSGITSPQSSSGRSKRRSMALGDAAPEDDVAGQRQGNHLQRDHDPSRAGGKPL